MKLHPRSIPYRILQRGGAVVFILAFSVLGPTMDQGVAGVLGAVAIVVVGLALVVGWQVAYHRRYEYELTDDSFDIASGVLSRRHREIPLERVQNVDIAQNPIHRFLGIAEVRLETAGGSESEARLRYVGTEEADRLQDAISEAKRRLAGEETGETAADEPEETPLFELQDEELAILGVVSADFRLFALVASVAPFLAPVLLDQVPSEFDLLWVIGPLVVGVSILGLWVLSGVYAIFRYYGFELTRQGDELRYERGLLQRYSGSIPLDKVQTISVAENVLARRLGYASVRIETAGYAPGQNQGQRIQSAVPIAKRDRALDLARQVEPCGEFDFDRPPKRARLRYAFRYGIAYALLLAVVAGAHLATGSIGWWPALGVGFLLVPPAAHLKWANLGYDLGRDHVITRQGFWSRRITVVPYDRVQTILRTRTVFQRRRRLGTLIVDTAAGGGLRSRDAAAIDIDAATAADLSDEVNRRFQGAVARPSGSTGTASD